MCVKGLGDFLKVRTLQREKSWGNHHGFCDYRVPSANPITKSGYDSQFAMENPPIFKFGKPSISIRAIYTMANCQS